MMDYIQPPKETKVLVPKRRGCILATNEILFLVTSISGAVLLVVFAILLALYGGPQLNLPGDLAAIEQIRVDVATNPSEDVVGQATQWNQTIASNKRYNRLWWSEWFIPDEWDSVEFIQIPKER